MGLILGLATGIIFGVLIQQGGLVRFEKQVNMLLLKDMTVLRFMLTAISVGMIGIIILGHFEIIAFNHRPLNLGALIIGSSIFGIGWAFTGLCPGTSLGALGEGRLHAIFAIAGMIAGAMIFNRSFNFLSNTVMSWIDFGNLTMSDIIGISNFVIIPVFILLVILLMRYLDKKGV